MRAPARDKKPVDPIIWQADSVLWYSRELARHLSAQRFASYVGRFNYGNMDVSGEPGKSNGLSHAWITSIGFGLYASKNYLARHPVREDQSPIAGHRLITWGDPLTFLALPKTLRSWVESGIANLTVDSMQAQVLAMKAGNGLGVLPCILADAEDQLVRIKPDLCRQEEAIWLVIHEAVRDTKRIRVVCDFLESVVKQGQPALSGQAA